MKGSITNGLDMHTITEVTTIQIKRELMKELKIRAVHEDLKYSDYLERVLKDQWKKEDKLTNGIG